MISVYRLKPRFQNLLRSSVRRLFEKGVTANQVTVGACLGSLLVAALVAGFASHHWLYALIPLWMLLRMAFNAIDGMLAREFGQKSRLGAYLNELTDVIADSALYLPFALLPGVNSLWVGLVVALAIISEYAGALGPMIGASRRYDGPMGKSDRALCFGVLGAGVATGWLPLDWIDWLLIVIAVLLLATLHNRVRQGLAEVEKQSAKE
ncbi:CDP-alcohol phosphatidyltransferase [Litchfieldella anticariensis FP35 = DSM 16096]|uniref:CDP-alcohol phosphatidyltransferase n=1 Tax=Litchfieldella anticariensis (strain DSM 16096 / CECT 5854 / CIP 108499 / LMG 22089 / FP35) TaxID=1121939 RepID=S2KQA6_LITA3|nr:CDP-alcohol phosphatidyltransferase family protein [Halomonas anticariensis]EPC04065.1 CDP-alcohol phosphatidyltransferase [Halomonas anticariensis FP35 = DSM 16096]